MQLAGDTRSGDIRETNVQTIPNDPVRRQIIANFAKAARTLDVSAFTYILSS